MALLRCTDGRSADIPDWLYAEYHLTPYALGDRSCPYGPEVRMPLETARYHNRCTFECVARLAQTASAAAVALTMIRNAHRVTK